MANMALMNQMTRSVVVNRFSLCEQLRKNRHKHLEAYRAAMAAYKDLACQKVEAEFARAAEELEAQKAKILDKLATFSPETAENFSDRLTIVQGIVANLPVPRSFVDAYDAALAMFDADIRDTLELTGAEFQCFCRDIWDWSDEFQSSTASYCAPRR